ncbi:thiamine-binding protein [Aciditerrimonas ferrireducens]|jgi:uncharacterized protein YqgV (UPF0045/DUF77 family)|uniref:Thiamine-binding protein n=1 Tax=Aciditerrimonas ferrireducens TaxID=667306 RepID=A0ABV6BZV1_9ACTN
MALDAVGNAVGNAVGTAEGQPSEAQGEATAAPWLRAEATVEPFVPGQRGPHVEALAEAARSAGVRLVVGPFGDLVEGPAEAVARALAEAVRAAFAAGASRLTVQVTREEPPEPTDA